jgi:hypothetical protein
VLVPACGQAAMGISSPKSKQKYFVILPPEFPASIQQLTSHMLKNVICGTGGQTRQGYRYGASPDVMRTKTPNSIGH